MIKRALDISNYTGDINAEQAECWKANGFQKVIVGTQRADIARRQMQVIIDAGLELEAYAFLYWTSETASQVNYAVEVCRSYPVARLWLDCEDDPRGLSADELVGRIDDAVMAQSDIPVGIYTGAWWWAKTGDSRAFSHLPLWHAAYLLESGRKPSDEYRPDFDSFSPYGGWSRPAMWQYAGSVQECGANVDLNAYEEAEVPVPAEEVPDQAALLRGLVAAAFVVSIGNPLSDLSPVDRASVRWVAEQL